MFINNLAGEDFDQIATQAHRVSDRGYDEKDLNARAELFRRAGHYVISVADAERPWELSIQMRMPEMS